MELIENYVNEEFETEVLKLIPKVVKNTFHRNHIIRYGSKIPYGPYTISDVIPDLFKFIDKMEFDSVTVNEYKTGQMIPWHTDYATGGPYIGIISLLSSSNLDFRKKDEYKSLLLPRFSLFILSGEMRYDWEHSFVATEPRVSVVLRNSKLK